MLRCRDTDALAVDINDTQGYLRVDSAHLAGLVRRALALEGRDRASVSIALVDDATIHAINRAYLGHDWPTDVLSFPFSGAEDELAIERELERGRENEDESEDETENEDEGEARGSVAERTPGGVLAGELVVSVERALTVARELGAAPFDELVLYLVHGLLHLCGHDDADGPAAAVMRRREDEILIALGFARPTRWELENGPVGGARPFAALGTVEPSEPCS